VKLIYNRKINGAEMTKEMQMPVNPVEYFKAKLDLEAGGWGGIRTHGSSRFGGFQDRYHKPLGHPSTDTI
jgi:hypothetical protein